MDKTPRPTLTRSKLAQSRTPRLPPDSLALSLTLAVDVISQVLDEGRSLTDILASQADMPQRPAVQDLSYTALRYGALSDELAWQLTGGKTLKPVRLAHLLRLSLALAADPGRTRYDPHTLVNQAVLAADSHEETRAGKGLLNACLRRFYREQDAVIATARRSESARWNFPEWWIRKLRHQQPAHWQAMLESAQAAPGMTLRVNRRVTTVERFVQACMVNGLAAVPLHDHAVWLPQPVAVNRIPGFELGHASVQDLAAQQAALLLEPQDGMRVLDACCAPGGKTGHLLELADLELLALDVDAVRLNRVADNLNRLNLMSDRVTLRAADIRRTDDWWDGRPFDAILADVPCTGSGVTRRHPDIRWLRRPEDVATMSHLQSKLLNVLWSVLKPGGTLLLVTCSIFGEEGEQLLQQFITHHADARRLSAPGLVRPESPPDGPGNDGFYYARLRKEALKHA